MEKLAGGFSIMEHRIFMGRAGDLCGIACCVTHFGFGFFMAKLVA